MRLSVRGKLSVESVVGVAVLSGMYLTSRYSYLLFHSVTEVFSVVVAGGIFIIAWNSRRFATNSYLLFLGIAYLFIGGLDLIHALAYPGMGVFEGYDTNLTVQLWIAARYLEAVSLLAAPLLIRRELRANVVFGAYLTVAALLLASILYWRVFPECFVEGTGLTTFKKASEYLISGMLLSSVALLLRRRAEFDSGVLRLLVTSIILTVLAELAFTLYVGVFDLPNLVGHLLKIASFYLIYKAIIETGLRRPFDLLFRDARRREETLRKAHEELGMLNQTLEQRVAERTAETEQRTHDLGERVKELACVAEISRLFQDPALSLPEILEGIVRIIPPSWQYPDITCARIVLEDEEYASNGFRETVWKQESEIGVSGEGVGTVEVFYVDERPESDEGPFLQEERNLIEVVAAMLGSFLERRRSEEMLLRSEASLRDAQRTAHIGSWERDIATDDTRWSDECYRILGLTPQEFRATRDAFYSFVHPDDRDRVQRTVDLALETGEPFSTEQRMVRPDGTERIVRGRGETLYDNAGEPWRTVGTVQDITEERTLQRRAEAAAEETASVLASAPNPIIVVDQQGTLLRANDAVREVFGWEPQDLVGQPVDVLVAGLDPADHARFIQRHIDGSTGLMAPRIRERVGQRKDGGEFPAEVRVSEMPPLDGVRRFTATIQDITERKQAERDHEQARLAEVRGAFLATMSHELRTPLNSVLGFAQLLEREISGPLNETQVRQVRDILDAGEHLLSLINDVLEIAKIDAGHMELALEPLDPAVLIDEAVRGLRETAVQKGLDFQTVLRDAPREVVADRRSLRQIVINLVSNAVKFTDQGSVVVRARGEDSHLVLEVEDTGIGIADSDLEHLFEEFVQANSSVSREHEGTGLGLAITRRLVTLHGGSVSVDSEPGRGSTFTVRLPLRPTPPDHETNGGGP